MMRDLFGKFQLSKFWMAKTEVTWDEYLAFFRATGSQGRTEGHVVTNKKTDAISGATPPWGAPDQGWGKGSRPAITMSWHAANVYCSGYRRLPVKNTGFLLKQNGNMPAGVGQKLLISLKVDPKKFTSSRSAQEKYLVLIRQRLHQG